MLQIVDRVYFFAAPELHVGYRRLNGRYGVGDTIRDLSLNEALAAKLIISQ